MTLQTSQMEHELTLAAEHAEAAGRAGEARWLRESRLYCLPLGAVSHLSSEAATLALVLLHCGEVAPARQRLATALRVGSTDDVVTVALTRAAQGWLAALDGDPTAASAHLQSAVHKLPEGQLLDRAPVHIACAEAMLALGDRQGAARRRQAAIDLYERKGNLVGAAHHRERLAELPR